MLRRFVEGPWFALTDVLLALASGVCWVLNPGIAIWFTFLACLPAYLRLLANKAPVQRTPLDWLMVIFVITAWLGYWAAYDKTTAWIKVWLIMTAILLYYALSAQTKQTLVAVSFLSFCLGLGMAIHFFLTYNFTGTAATILSWWIHWRPQAGWTSIHPGYTSGLLVVTNLFAFHWLQSVKQKAAGIFSMALKLFSVFGLVIVSLAFILTLSRGIWAAIGCGLGAWIIWWVVNRKEFGASSKLRSLFPIFISIYLVVTIVLLYLVTAQTGLGSGAYGDNTRAEVLTNSMYFPFDYMISGGGLGSFPGLYSQYILAVPFFYFVNSYNTFLDVAVEQGLLGGFAFTLIYLGSVWLVCRRIAKAHGDEMQPAHWVSLLALVVTIVHGSIYDYLYNGNGTLLMFFPAGMTMIGFAVSIRSDIENEHASNKRFPEFSKTTIMTSVLILAVGLAVNFNKIAALWYANLGAVQMSQVELRDFPTNQWATSEIVSQLTDAETSFRSAVQYDPYNQTAHYRLGLISMLRQDFSSAATHLEIAYKGAPAHRGIIKNLGYCYVWLGEMDKAADLLGKIPEARGELKVYVWWWRMQGRDDLSTNALQQVAQFDDQVHQP